MSIILNEIIAIESSHALSSMPRSDNAALELIPTMALHDVFTYKGMLGNSHRFTHNDTGHTVALQPVFFLDSDRFYYTLKGTPAEKTALFVNSPTAMKALFENKTINVKVGTIFDQYRENLEDSRFYIVTSNTGQEYSIFKSTCIRICDIEKDSHKAPLLKVDIAEPKTVAPPVIEPLTFNRCISLNGFEFSSTENADAAEKFVRDLNELIHSATFSTTRDAENAFALAKSLGAFTAELDTTTGE